jgi:hypothetical protein
MTLTWTKKRDGEHNGRPVYEYKAVSGDREYNIVWAYDHGGTFGYSAVRRNGPGDAKYLTERYGIHWARTLKSCKFYCEQIEAKETST